MKAKTPENDSSWCAMSDEMNAIFLRNLLPNDVLSLSSNSLSSMLRPADDF